MVQKVLTMVADFLQRFTIFKGNVASKRSMALVIVIISCTARVTQPSKSDDT
jgi:hypothetical protein